MPLTKSNCNKNPLPPTSPVTTGKTPGTRRRPGRPEHPSAYYTAFTAAPRGFAGPSRHHNPKQINPNTPRHHNNKPQSEQSCHAEPAPTNPPKNAHPVNKNENLKKRHAATTQKLDPMETIGCYFLIRQPKISLNHL